MRSRDRNVVGLVGGFGNQLFEYSFGKWLSHNTDRPTSFDLSALRSGLRKPEILDFVPRGELAIEPWTTTLLPYPGGRLGAGGKFLRAVRGPRGVIFEGRVGALEFNRPAWWYGYWQSIERVQDVIEDLRIILRSRIPEIAGGTVGVHVRRGDYLGNALALGAEYYNAGVAQLLRRSGTDLHVQVFSDDTEWCQSNLKFDCPTEILPTGTTLHDFGKLMSCEYLVLSNSTYSWWAAVLPPRDQCKVLAADRFIDSHGISLRLRSWQRVEDPRES